MATIDVNALVRLSQKFEDDLSKFEEMPKNVKEALERKLEHEATRKADEAATSILELFKKADVAVEDSVSEIRRYRAIIAQNKRKLDDIKMAREYGIKTMNFIPLLSILGIVLISDDAKKDFEMYKKAIKQRKQKD